MAGSSTGSPATPPTSGRTTPARPPGPTVTVQLISTRPPGAVAGAAVLISVAGPSGVFSARGDAREQRRRDDRRRPVHRADRGGAVTGVLPLIVRAVISASARPRRRPPQRAQLRARGRIVTVRWRVRLERHDLADLDGPPAHLERQRSPACAPRARARTWTLTPRLSCCSAAATRSNAGAAGRLTAAGVVGRREVRPSDLSADRAATAPGSVAAQHEQARLAGRQRGVTQVGYRETGEQAPSHRAPASALASMTAGRPRAARRWSP